MSGLPGLRPEDPLGRYIFSKRQAKQARSCKVPREVFQPPEGDPIQVSVDRLDYAPDEEMARIAERAGEGRGKTFHGWAVVTVEKAGENGGRPIESPLLDNPYHADIRFPAMTGADVRDQIKDHAYRLARHAKFRAPPAEPDQRASA